MLGLLCFYTCISILLSGGRWSVTQCFIANNELFHLDKTCLHIQELCQGVGGGDLLLVGHAVLDGHLGIGIQLGFGFEWGWLVPR